MSHVAAQTPSQIRYKPSQGTLTRAQKRGTTTHYVLDSKRRHLVKQPEVSTTPQLHHDPPRRSVSALSHRSQKTRRRHPSKIRFLTETRRRPPSCDSRTFNGSNAGGASGLRETATTRRPAGCTYLQLRHDDQQTNSLREHILPSKLPPSRSES